MADIKFGIQLGSTWTQGIPSSQQLGDQSRRVEELGFDSLHTDDHIASPPDGPAGVLHCLPVLGAMATVTQRVKVGPYALQLPTYNPALVARAMLTIDHLSDGRAILAVSQGDIYDNELEIAGITAADRGPRQQEGLRVINGLWFEDSFSIDGDISNFNNVNMEPKSTTPGGIPIWISGQHSGALVRAAKQGKGWAAPKCTPEFYKESVAKIIDSLAEVGRDVAEFDFVVELGIHMDRNANNARKEAAKALGESKEPPAEVLLKDSFALGSPDDCANRIQEFLDAGVSWFVLTPMCSLADLPAQIESYAQELLPRFARVKASA